MEQPWHIHMVLKQNILRAIPALKDATNCNDNLLDLLVSNGILTTIDKGEIKSKADPDSQKSELYSKLHQKPQKLRETIKALETCEQKLPAEILREAWNDKFNGCTSIPLSQKTYDAIWFEIEFVAETFIGRHVELENLHETISASKNRSTVFNHITTLVGLGGIGKSTLALEYAHKYKDYYNGNAIWINADSEVSFRNSFTRLLKKYFYRSEETSNEEMVQIVYDHFSKNELKCLIIFDNVNDFDVLKLLPKYFDTPNPVIPHVLITSRTTTWRQGVNLFSLDVLSVENAVKFLLNCTSDHKNVKQEDLVELAGSLQRLPLALQQAAAYIRAELSQDHNPIKKYRDLIKSDENCLAIFNYRNERLSEHEETTFRTWNITLESIKNKENCSLAIKIMNIISFLEPDNIPAYMFCEFGPELHSNSSEDNLSNTEAVSLIGDAKFTKEAVNRAILILKSYSMVSGPVGVINVHRVVQRVVQLQIRSEITMVLEEGLIYIRSWIRKIYARKSEIIHALTLWRHALHYDSLVRDYGEFPSFLCQKSKISYTLKLAKESRLRIESVLGQEHKNTIRVKFWEAMWHNKHGKYSESLNILKEIRPFVMGEIESVKFATRFMERFLKLTSMNLRGEYKYEEELSVVKKLEEFRISKYGLDHRKTVETSIRKATILTDKGNFEEASEILQRVKEIHISSYTAHKHILYELDEFASVLIKKRKFAEAVDVHRAIVDFYKKTHGVEYTGTLNSMKDLVKALLENDELEKGKAVLTEVVEITRKVYNEEGDVTLKAIENLVKRIVTKDDINEALVLLTVWQFDFRCK